jgi:ribosomal protein S8
MNYYKPNQIQNHFHFALSQKNPYSRIMYTKYTLYIIRILAASGCIHKYNIGRIFFKKKYRYYIGLTVLMYRNTPFFKSMRLVSTPSNQYNISYKALRITSLSIGNSVILPIDYDVIRTAL